MVDRGFLYLCQLSDINTYKTCSYLFLWVKNFEISRGSFL